MSAESPPPERRDETADRLPDRDPHHALNNPVGEPDPTEWPDPYDQRADPRDPGAGADGEAHPITGSTSTSDPHPAQDPEARDRRPPSRDRSGD